MKRYDSPPPRPCSRRRILRIVAGLAGAAAVPWPVFGKSNISLSPPHRWEGAALGAEGSILLYHPDAAIAQDLLDRCVREIERLESLFSLYRPHSALCRLNRLGRLPTPPEDFIRLLALAKKWHRLTGGAFDVTVQPLWELYARHFASPTADPAGPPPARIARIRESMGVEAIRLSPVEIRLQKPGMALTLNGIAQGYITDRVTELLRAYGLQHILVELGEFRAGGPRPDGNPWQIGIADPKQPWRAIETLSLQQGAVATSGSYGLFFEPSGRHHHLFNPLTGQSPSHHRSVTVLAPDATTADALSTALAILPRTRGEALLGKIREISAVFVDAHSIEYVGPKRFRKSVSV